MGKYDVELKIERDADGHVTRAGASWGETRPGNEKLLLWVSCSSLFAVVAGGLWALGTKSLNPLLEWGLVGVIAGPLALTRMSAVPRGLYFRARGAIETPFGIFHRPNWLGIAGDHDDIVSIEARPQRDQPETDGSWETMFELIILSGSGDLVCISRNLHEWVAIKAAAQLTNALGKVRRERPNGGAAYDAWVQLS